MTPIVEYIKTGEKSSRGNIGLEIEHFILNDATGKPMPYAQMLELLDHLKAHYEKATYEEGHLIALESKTTLITLEPGCQLELSFAYTSDLKAIEGWYEQAIAPIKAWVIDKGYSIVYSGGIPTIDVDEIQRIPKERYRLMEAWFSHAGGRGKEMMKGSASIHISIDFQSEADFVKKYQMANLLHPFFNFITSNTPYYEGKKNEDILLRSSIWENTDPVRTGYMPYSFDPDLGYEKYVRFLEGVPLIVGSSKEGLYDAKNATMKEIAQKDGYAQEQIAHYLSMVFPFVRLKKFIEIRSADAMPLSEMMAYCALIKGLFYSKEALDHYAKIAQKASVASMYALEEQIREHGWETRIEGRSIQAILKAMVERAKASLSDEERQMLAPLERRIDQKRFVFERKEEHELR